jgi:hypothetical protein
MRATISSTVAVVVALVLAFAWLRTSARADQTGRSAPTAELKRTLRLPRGVPIAVRATVGDISIAGWDRPDVEVVITRTAATPEGLSDISAAIDADSDGLRVTTVQAASSRDARLRGSVVLRVPADHPIASLDLFEGTIALLDLRGGVRASVEHGSIAAVSLGGPIRLETVIGDIRLENAALAESAIHLRAFNGNVTLSFPATPAHARILALSLDGSIRSDIPLTLKTAFGPRFGEATLGGGGPLVSIDVVSGGIRINRGAR